MSRKKVTEKIVKREETKRKEMEMSGKWEYLRRLKPKNPLTTNQEKLGPDHVFFLTFSI